MAHQTINGQRARMPGRREMAAHVVLLNRRDRRLQRSQGRFGVEGISGDHYDARPFWGNNVHKHPFSHNHTVRARASRIAPCAG